MTTITQRKAEAEYRRAPYIFQFCGNCKHRVAVGRIFKDCANTSTCNKLHCTVAFRGSCRHWTRITVSHHPLKSKP
jgi:hypothetical protein